MRGPAPDVPEGKDNLPKARGEERQENDPSHHVLQHGHLEKPGPESISPTRAGIKQAPSQPHPARVFSCWFRLGHKMTFRSCPEVVLHATSQADPSFSWSWMQQDGHCKRQLALIQSGHLEKDFASRTGHPALPADVFMFVQTYMQEIQGPWSLQGEQEFALRKPQPFYAGTLFLGFVSVGPKAACAVLQGEALSPWEPSSSPSYLPQDPYFCPLP